MDDKVVPLLTIIAVLQAISMSSIGPFFPFEAEKKNVEPFYLGLIMGAIPSMKVVGAILSGNYLHKIGKGPSLWLGMSLAILQPLCLAAVKFVDSTYWFTTLSLTANCVGGLGVGINTTTVMSIIATYFVNDREKNLGIYQAGNGLGYLLGPLIGSALYNYGGYCMPFLTVAGLSILFLPAICYSLSVVRQFENMAREGYVSGEQESQEKQV